MNITYITEYFPYEDENDISGGVEARCINITKRLAKKHNVTVITSWKKGQERKHKIKNIRILRVGPHHEYSNEKNVKSRLDFAKAAYNLAKKVKSDIIEGYNFITYLPAYYAAKEQNAKKIATYHEVWKGEWIKNKGLITGILGEVWERKTLNLKWDKIFAVSETTAKKIKNQKVKIIYNGINLNEYKKKETKYKTPTIISISRLTPKKRVEDLIKATYLIKKQVPKIKLIIVGKGEEYKKLRALANRLRLKDNVKFTGYVDDKTKLKLLKKSHIFCLPSILEGFGISLVEAMAAQTPYVCSDIEVLQEVTENQKGGLIFKQKNYKDLTNKILFLLKNKKLYTKKQEQARALLKKYNWDTIAKQVEKEYTY